MTDKRQQIKELNGYTVYEFFVESADGSLTSGGFRVFDPGGRPIRTFSTRQEAFDYLDQIADPSPPGADLDM